MKSMCANYKCYMVRFASVLTSLVVAMTFAMASSANAAAPGMNGADLIHKGNAAEIIHKGKGKIGDVVMNNQMTSKSAEVVSLAAARAGGVRAAGVRAAGFNRVNNNRIGNGIFGRGLLGEPFLGRGLFGLGGLGLGLGDFDDLFEE